MIPILMHQMCILSLFSDVQVEKVVNPKKCERADKNQSDMKLSQIELYPREIILHFQMNL
jgi:hypothetical protein